MFLSFQNAISQVENEWLLILITHYSRWRSEDINLNPIFQLGSIKSTNAHCHRCGTPNRNQEDTGSTINGSEPVYQGIIERDIGVLRKENEISALKAEMAKLKTELNR